MNHAENGALERGTERCSRSYYTTNRKIGKIEMTRCAIFRLAPTHSGSPLYPDCVEISTRPIPINLLPWLLC